MPNLQVNLWEANKIIKNCDQKTPPQKYFASYIKMTKSMKVLYAKSTKYSQRGKDSTTHKWLPLTGIFLVLLNIYISENADFILHDKKPGSLSNPFLGRY